MDFIGVAIRGTKAWGCDHQQDAISIKQRNAKKCEAEDGKGRWSGLVSGCAYLKKKSIYPWETVIRMCVFFLFKMLSVSPYI